jgi:hypothetical protein
MGVEIMINKYRLEAAAAKRYLAGVRGEARSSD